VQKNPLNSGSAVYENLAYFLSKIEAPFAKSVSVSTFGLVQDMGIFGDFTPKNILHTNLKQKSLGIAEKWWCTCTCCTC